MSEELPARTEDWRTIEVSPRKDTDELLRKSVHLATLWKPKNMTEEEMIAKIVNEKLSVTPGYLDISCTNLGRHEALSSMLDTLIDNETTRIVTDDEIRLGFLIYSATVYCSDTSKQLYKFFSRLFSSETHRTILLALVNTIRSASVAGFENKLLLNDFYQFLDNILKLRYGEILLATASREDLQKMLDKNWPFFKNNTGIVARCLCNDQCWTSTEWTNTLWVSTS